MPRHILFVCLGNICRSCTAEEIFRTLARRAGLDSRYEVDSAGIIDYHEGELPDARMRQTALRHGYRLTHRSRPIRPADFERFDLIIGMDDRNCDKLRRLAPTEEGKQKVAAMATPKPTSYPTPTTARRPTLSSLSSSSKTPAKVCWRKRTFKNRIK